MKRNPTALFTSGLLAALVSVALTACDRPGEPARPTTTGSASNPRDTMAGNDAMGIGSPTTSPGAMVESNPTAAGNPSGGQLSLADRTFLRNAAEDGLYEVAAARVAVERAKDPAVKSFASMLVEHHASANEKLRQLASSNGVQLPTSVPADKQQIIDKLNQASGSDFDKQFVQQVGIRDHQTDISKFEQASQTAHSPAVKEFAQSTLPTLRGHLSEAQKLPPG